MSATKLVLPKFVSAIPFNWVDTSLDVDDLNSFAVKDPMPTQWRTLGLCEMPNGDFILNHSGGFHLCVQVNERILPSKVRDEKVNALVERHMQQEGRKPSRKLYAELREQAEMELLPKAFIRRSHTLVTFVDGGRLLIWTTSWKRADDVLRLLVDVFPSTAFTSIQTQASITGFMRDVAIVVDGFEGYFPGSAGVFKDSDNDEGANPVVRVRNLDVGSSAEIEKLVERNGYMPVELSMRKADDISFTLTDKFAFKKIVVPQVSVTDKEDPLGAWESALWLYTQGVNKVVTDILDVVGTAGEDEDEL